MSSSSLFLRTLLTNPRMVGAIAPSSAMLANLITSEVDPSVGPVLELGPGTGVFTQALLRRGVCERDITLIESAHGFASLLRNRFPEARVICADAARLGAHNLPDGVSFGCAISGLPLLNMSPKTVIAILNGVSSRLREGGAFYQFTYGLRCPVPYRLLDRFGFKATLHGQVLRNFPPARVYKIVRRRPLHCASVTA
ncbi:methyltransferase domain-containing protein [Rhizobium sp. 60-20]|jgi:phosphatidylethanolamine/phosphatidyl-N-methylethanolamine N-methyltransferase|uniref:class I SAM-dependent methyltransferase n=2 Tax=unclassified Rhizobium TaxID=2613769 RepID=UPI000646558D|nr:methyltransferase domain-containing protein [Rhizobium sp. 60-20]MBN8953021.1 methyltransferase domain-containing protein [Rhizobium tropici]OJY64651.1 MAG: phospholipid methyltransferase [Rhizobium sp. 60-20]RKD72487.1 phospholipid N-methyltransferase [Rhizobium sp. WW_1]